MTLDDFSKITIKSSYINDSIPLQSRFDVFIREVNQEKPLVIALHSFGKSKEFNLNIAEFLAESGFNVALMDFPLHGDRLVNGKDIWNFGSFTAKTLTDFFKRTLSDLKTLADHFSGRTIYLWGVSLGGIASIYSAVKDSRFKKVFTALASADIKTSIKGMKHLPHLPLPLKFLLWTAFRILNAVSSKSLSPFQSLMKLSDQMSEPEISATLDEVNPINFTSNLKDQQIFLLASITDRVIKPESVIKTYLSNPSKFLLEFSSEKGHRIAKEKLFKATELFFTEKVLSVRESVEWRLNNIGTAKNGTWKVGGDTVAVVDSLEIVDNTKADVILVLVKTRDEAEQVIERFFNLKGKEVFAFDGRGKRYGRSRKANFYRLALLNHLNFVRRTAN